MRRARILTFFFYVNNADLFLSLLPLCRRRDSAVARIKRAGLCAISGIDYYNDFFPPCPRKKMRASALDARICTTPRRALAQTRGARMHDIQLRWLAASRRASLARPRTMLLSTATRRERERGEGRQTNAESRKPWIPLVREKESLSASET